MMILVAGVLGACGSMAVNDPYVEALPEGFNAQEYMSLHPELRARQLKDFVADYNDMIKKTMDNASYTAKKAADDAAFLQDSERLSAIYTHPQIGAHSYEQWATLVAQMSSADSVANEIFNSLAEYNFIDVADDAALLLTVPVDYVAISQQFNTFGREHGWAYRACRANEAANPVRDTLSIAKKQASRATSAAGFTPDTGLYCRDALGVDRLIQ